MHYDNYNLHCVISIHALLAESDASEGADFGHKMNFYPRSPCGERHSVRPETRQHDAISIHALLAESDPHGQKSKGLHSVFLSTLSLRRATYDTYAKVLRVNISIHALLAESDTPARMSSRLLLISIHALLAESDGFSYFYIIKITDFYPRSPCGERPRNGFAMRWNTCISIHALLAESDTL